ncbi:MAG: amidohydrolase [Candidatus Melainabacteria bacterium]|nr:amidohydrolase [Candidatus Melainabacteria bacterium]
MFNTAQVLVREPVLLSTTLEQAKRMQAEIINIRRHVHAHPELNFKEFETSKFAAHRLQSLGFSVKTFSNHTGIVADYGTGNLMVAIRSDMDATALPELNRVGYASQNAGIMHACGHDAHLACALGAAEILTKMNVRGRIRIIIQPGDDPDGKLGITTMMESGCLDGVDAVLGLHVDATMPSRKVGVVCGATVMSEQIFKIGVEQNDQKPTVMLDIARMICALNELSLFSSSDVPIGEVILDSVRGHKIAVPDSSDSLMQGVISGTLKTFNDDIRNQAHEEIEKSIRNLNPAATIEFGDNHVSAIESAKIVDALRGSALDLLGSSEVMDLKRRSWNSQFSLMTEHAPGAMMYLGAEITSSRRSHQSQTFDIDESCLHVGAAVLAETAMRIINEL